MGLIRKSLAVSTVGLVRPNSKKQRVAKANLKANQTAARTMAAQLAIQQQQQRQEHEYKYATNSVYRRYIDEQQAELERVQAEQAAARAEKLRRRIAAIGAAVSYIGIAIAVAFVATFVWSMQTVVAGSRRRPRVLWKRRQLSDAWSGVEATRQRRIAG